MNETNESNWTNEGIEEVERMLKALESSNPFFQRVDRFYE